MKCLNGKYCPCHTEKQPWINLIPTTAMWNVSTFRKHNKKISNKLLWSGLLSRTPCYPSRRSHEQVLTSPYEKTVLVLHLLTSQCLTYISFCVWKWLVSLSLPLWYYTSVFIIKKETSVFLSEWCKIFLIPDMDVIGKK